MASQKPVGQKQTRTAPIDLVATTVHELKSPLVVISGLAQMLGSGQFGKLNTQQTRYIERIDAVSQRMLNLVEGLLTVNRSQYFTIQPRPVALPKIINQVIAELEPRLKQNQMELVYRRRQVSPVLVDARYVYQIIYNLVDNAIKYSPPKTSITIKFRQQNHNLYLRVSDQGVGVKPTDLKHLYKRFGKQGQPVSGMAGSSGLGLFIVKQLAEAHGGRLRAKTLAQGTCFIVRLPLAQQLNLFKPVTG